MHGLLVFVFVWPVNYDNGLLLHVSLARETYV